jgi:hypothetical protein
VPFVLAENNIRAEYLYARGPITYDPRTIVDELVGRAGISGLMLGLDHLVDHYATQGIDPRAVLDDPRIQRSTLAVHIAGHGHAPLRPGDARHVGLLRKLTATPFANPVRLAFDYTPIGMLRYSERQQVRLLEQTIRWIRDLHR